MFHCTDGWYLILLSALTVTIKFLLYAWQKCSQIQFGRWQMRRADKLLFSLIGKMSSDLFFLIILLKPFPELSHHNFVYASYNIMWHVLLQSYSVSKNTIQIDRIQMSVMNLASVDDEKENKIIDADWLHIPCWNAAAPLHSPGCDTNGVSRQLKNLRMIHAWHNNSHTNRGTNSRGGFCSCAKTQGGEALAYYCLFWHRGDVNSMIIEVCFFLIFSFQLLSVIF